MPEPSPATPRRTTACPSVWPAIAIVVFLVVAGLVMLGNRPRHARSDPIVSNMSATVMAIQIYRADTGAFPPSISALVTGTTPYLERIPVDAWGRPLGYTQDQDGGITVFTLGEDGAVGGVGAASDLSKRVPPNN